jgi:LPS-assembly protein
LKTALLLLLLAAPAAAEDYALPPPPPGPHADYKADKAEFDADRSLLHLSGNVELKESTWTVKGQDLWVDTDKRRGRSDGPLLIEDGWSAVYGESGEFDFAKHTGRLEDTSAGMASWTIHAKQATLGADRSLQYRAADFTSCDRKPPDYHFHASSVHVVPKKRMTATNVLFYLGRVPVFYTPFLYKPLTKRHWLGWKSSPGLDRRNGPFLKNTLLTQYSDSLYSKLYADVYTRQGFGYGGELERHQGSDSRGDLYGYRIHETSTGDTRWTLLANAYQAIGSSDSFQGRFQLQSDADFNNAYARSSTFRVTPYLINDGALVHRFRTGVARLSYSRTDVASDNRTHYLKTVEDAPSLTYQSQPLAFRHLPWLNTFSGLADNNFDRSRGFLQKTVAGGWEGTRSFHIARGVSFAPKAGYVQTYYSRFDEAYGSSASTMTYLDAPVGRWSAGGTLRFGTPAGDWDLTQTYQKRLAPGSLAGDAGATDKGVETNLLTLSDLLLPLPRVYARVSSGWDFRTYRDKTVGFRDRLQPVVTEVSWDAADALSLTFRDDYQLQQGNRALIADALWGRETGPTVGGGVSHNLADPSHYYGTVQFAVAPSSPSWRVSIALRGLVESDGGFADAHGLRVFDKEIAWTQRWHDFYTKLAARFRTGGVGEATVRVDFKFGTTDPKQAPRRDWEAEWFPERAAGGDLRP